MGDLKNAVTVVPVTLLTAAIVIGMRVLIAISPRVPR
jgi:hypothetical protein